MIGENKVNLWELLFKINKTIISQVSGNIERFNDYRNGNSREKLGVEQSRVGPKWVRSALIPYKVKSNKEYDIV